jgi:hypothetical protein
MQTAAAEDAEDAEDAAAAHGGHVRRAAEGERPEERLAGLA